jgi:hypothetical protein
MREIRVSYWLVLLLCRPISGPEIRRRHPHVVMVACTYISVDRDSRTILAADCVNGTRCELNVVESYRTYNDIGLFVE